MIQILSGIGLSLVYVPTADQAYESLVYLNDQQPLGWFLRSLHYWSGSAMVVACRPFAFGRTPGARQSPARGGAGQDGTA